MSDIYLSLTETPTVVTLSQPVVSGALAGSVTVTNVVSVNVVTMPAINVSAPSVTTVDGTVTVTGLGFDSDGNLLVTLQPGPTPYTQPISGTVTVGNSVTIAGTVTIGNFPANQTIQGTVTANTGLSQPLTDAQLRASAVPVSLASLPASTVTARLQDASGNNLTSTSIGGVQRLNVSLASAATAGGTLPSFINVHGGTDGSVARTMLLDSSGRTVVTGTIAGTVTASQFFTVVTSQTINFSTTVTSTEAFNTGNDYDFVVIQSDLTNSAGLGTIYIDRYTSPTASGGSSNYGLWDDTNKKSFTGGGGNNLCSAENQKITLLQTGFPSQFYYRFRTVVTTGGIFGSAKLYAIKSIYPYSANLSAWDVGKVPIAGNVYVRNSSVTIGSLPSISGTVTAMLQDASGNNLTSTSIGGVQRLNVSLASAATPGGSLPSFVNVYGGSDSGTVRALAVDSSGRTVVTVSNFPSTQAVSLASTTVTVSALPSGALTTRFGSVTTANTAQITSAVTNTSRKYLLAQNISAGTVTIGIGFSPTTTQGIQLTAGGGLTFDAFCPTGAVYWLGAVTGAAFTILEG